MTDEHAEKIVRMREEIRDRQRLQLERQAKALQSQKRSWLSRANPRPVVGFLVWVLLARVGD